MHVSLYFLTLLKSHLQKGNNNVYFLGVFRRLNAVISVLTQKHWINQLLPDWNWACGETDSFLATQIPFITLWISNTFICIGLSRSTWHEGKASCGRCRGDEWGQPLLLRVPPSRSTLSHGRRVPGLVSQALCLVCAPLSHCSRQLCTSFRLLFFFMFTVSLHPTPLWDSVHFTVVRSSDVILNATRSPWSVWSRYDLIYI